MDRYCKFKVVSIHQDVSEAKPREDYFTAIQNYGLNCASRLLSKCVLAVANAPRLIMLPFGFLSIVYRGWASGCLKVATAREELLAALLQSGLCSRDCCRVLQVCEEEIGKNQILLGRELWVIGSRAQT